MSGEWKKRESMSRRQRLGLTRRSSLRLAAAVLVLLLLSVSAVTAYYLRRTQTETNKFRGAYVSCEVQENFSNNQKSEVKVRNTSDVSAYIRVRLVTYWKTPSGKIAGRTAKLPAVSINASDWIQDSSNSTYYCKTAVAAGDSTPNLLSNPLVLQKDAGYIPVVEVLAEAIQAAPSSAVEAAWQKVVVSEEDGQLSLKQQ